MNEVSSPRRGLFLLGFKQESRARPGPGFWVGLKYFGVGPPEKFLAISPAPTPTTVQVYKIFLDKSR